MIRSISGVALAAMLAVPALAQMPAPTAKQFVMKAGASDLFERQEAKLMMSSSNPGVRAFAQKMMTAHTESTEKVKAAATADGVPLIPPAMMTAQKHDLAALTASKGNARDALYVTQQKAAHNDALMLMQTYASHGRATHLKQTASEIAPIVQTHIDMLAQMPM